MNRNYRWGILGPGRIAEKFCTAIDYVNGSEVYAVASRSMDKAKEFGAKFNASKFYDSYDMLWKDDAVDIIYIATPHAFHHEHAMQCLQHKKAVLCEKPMSLCYQQSKEMTDAATANKVFLMEAMWTSCMPFIRKTRSLIDEDVIGPVQYISADFGFSSPVDAESRLFNKTLGGGSLLDVGIYPLYLATSILGEPTTIKAVSKLSVTGVDEYMNMVLQYSNGETAHLLSTINFNTPIEAEIIGTKGKIKINNPWFKATDFSVHLNDGTIQNFSVPHLSNGFEHEITEVMRCLNKGLLQSVRMPHHLTLSISKIMDDLLREAGVAYS
jgi:predicted dehydrogenase